MHCNFFKNIIYGLIVLLMAMGIQSCYKSSESRYVSSTGLGGSLARFTMVGNYLYLVDNDSLKTVDISDKHMPIIVSRQFLNFGVVETIYPFGDVLFIGSQNGMFIYNIKNPKTPVKESQVAHIRSCDPVVANEKYAFLTLRNNNIICGGDVNQLEIYDVIDKSKPNRISVLLLDNPYGLALNEGILYICDAISGIKIIDITDVKDPKVLNVIEGYDFRDGIIYNNMLLCMTSEGMVLYDITDPIKPSFLTELK